VTDAPTSLGERAAELRSKFDRAFAAPPRIDAASKHDLIAIRMNARPFALRVAEVSGLFVDRKVTRVPGAAAALLGIAGFRGALVPVYDLQALFGHSTGQTPRWLVVAAAAPVALAFDTFEAHLRALADSILRRQAQDRACGFAPEFIRAGDVIRPIIHLPSVVEALGTTELSQAAPTQE